MKRIKFRTKMIFLMFDILLMGLFSYYSAKFNFQKIEDMVAAKAGNLDTAALNTQLSELIDTRLRIMLIAIAIFFVIILFIGTLITADMIHSLNAASKYAIGLSRGNLSEKISDVYLKRVDSIGDLTRSMEQIHDHMGSLIRTIQTETGNLDRIVLNTNGHVTVMNEDIEGISATTQNLAAGMEETAASSEQMNATSQEIEAVAKNSNTCRGGGRACDRNTYEGGKDKAVHRFPEKACKRGQ